MLNSDSPAIEDATWANTSTTGLTTTINFGGPHWFGRVAGPLAGGEGTNLLRGTVAGGGPSFRPWFGRKGGALRSHSRRSLPRS